MPQRRSGNVHELRLARLAGVVFAPSHLASVGVKVRGDVVVLADLGPAQPREERLGLVGVRAFDAMRCCSGSVWRPRRRAGHATTPPHRLASYIMNSDTGYILNLLDGVRHKMYHSRSVEY